MSTEWKYSISIVTQDKVTGNLLANSIPNASDAPNADHFGATWEDGSGAIWYSTHSRMTQTGYDALLALVASGTADDFLAASHIQYGLADDMVRHVDFVLNLGMTPHEL